MTSSLLPKLKTPLLTNTFLTLTYSHRFPTQQKQTFVYKLSLARRVSLRAGSLHARNSGWPRVTQRDQGKPGASSSTRSGFSWPELPLPSRPEAALPRVPRGCSPFAGCWCWARSPAPRPSAQPSPHPTTEPSRRRALPPPAPGLTA